MTTVFQPLVLHEHRHQRARALIGDVAFDRALKQFDQHLQDVLNALPETEGELRFVAHRIAGAAANLGLEELAALSKLVASDGQLTSSAIDNMLGAARRAAEILSDRINRD